MASRTEKENNTTTTNADKKRKEGSKEKDREEIIIETPGEYFEDIEIVKGIPVIVQVLLEAFHDPISNRECFLVHKYHEDLAHDYSIDASYLKNNKRFIPIQESPFPKIGRPDLGEYDQGFSLKEIYDQVFQFIKSHIYFSIEHMYYTLTSYCIATWIFENFKSFPYINFLGDFGTGKTRGLEIIHALAHRALKTPDASSAVVFTIGEFWKPTLLYDESEGLQHETKQAILSLANAGYRKDSYAYRIDLKDGHRKIVKFNCYFPKSFAGTRELIKTLESRCIHFKMLEKPFNIKIEDWIDDEWAYKLRNKLFGFRLLNMARVVENLADIIDVQNTRIKELFTPLVFVTPQEYKDHIQEYAKMTEQQFNISRADTPAAALIEAIAACYAQSMQDGRRLYLSTLKATLEEDKEDLDLKDMPFSQKTIIKLLKEIGFRTETIKRNKKSRYIIWNEDFTNWLVMMINQYVKDIEIKAEALRSIHYNNNIDNNSNIDNFNYSNNGDNSQNKQGQG